ncbi:methyltransferase domain-containing protein [Nocardia sp. CA2R105]|uniref:class I SAM-dependent methyltransferase n=1 Tax=Nocardia coffeae TaxID=2873381 RepID=UPI001CA6F895|nr:methyltransferase domain-containing protein [Nocardia coffeae]MBY8860113.1 methyltransferase domain-containing protein [Nocardia coffeae]
MRSRFFAVWYSVLMSGAEPVLVRPVRAGLLSSARGNLLIVGLGPGHDLRYLPAAVTAVTAVEPNPVMRTVAARRARKLGVELDLIDGVAEALPFADCVFDTVVSPFLLCSVGDVAAALAELRRVLRPDGELLVLEHIRAADGTLLGRLQDLTESPWHALADGCHPNRRTNNALAAAGFDVSGLATGTFPLPTHISRYLVGRAPVASHPTSPADTGRVVR